MQKASHPQFPLLYSLRGFHYCDLLLGQNKHAEVRERAARTLEWAKEAQWLLDIALDHLSLGRAWLPEDRKEARQHLNEAVVGLRKAAVQDFIARGLLARAEFLRLEGDFAAAQHDLDEAFRIARRSEMRLHLTDCHLEQARLARAQGNAALQAEHAEKARKLIEETGYHRRDRELADLTQAP